LESLDALAKRYGSTGQFDVLASELDPIDPVNLSPGEAESWFHLRGIAEWRQRKSEAIDWFRAGLARLPDSGLLAFSLGQSLQEGGNWPEAREVFAGVRFGRTQNQQRLGLSAVHARFTMTIVRYCYLWGAFADGLAHLQPFLDAYEDLRIADDTFLYMRGLPFAGQVLETSCALSLLTGAPQSAQQTLDWAERKLRDIDLREDRLLLQGYVSGHWRPLHHHLTERLRGLNQFTKSHAGYLNTEMATIEVRSSPSLAAGQTRLDQVQLGAEDLGWLADVKLLGLFGLASRFGEDELREAIAAELMARQPFLLEPHHVFNFGLLDVQEPLRTRYQAARATSHAE
jgi:hypothetical protein